jgi:predicted GIY-YIG superfamily endonuclease
MTDARCPGRAVTRKFVMKTLQGGGDASTAPSLGLRLDMQNAQALNRGGATRSETCSPRGLTTHDEKSFRKATLGPENRRVRTFDRKFGVDFLAGVPSKPGVYRLYDAAGTLLYVGKARDLRRRLAQYRTTRRTKKDRKRRRLVDVADRIVWDVCDSEFDALLAEIRLIQSLRPRDNIAGAFPFLYPFIGIRVEGRETQFCLATSPAAFPSFAFHGAFRSREVTREAFFALMLLNSEKCGILN